MCIAIPGKIVSVVDESTATVDMGGVRRNVNMNLLRLLKQIAGLEEIDTLESESP